MAATVLVIDGGGRGSTLVDKYLQSPHVSKILAVPGNDLMLGLVANYKGKQAKIFPQFKTTDVEKIKKICQKYKVDLVDVAQDDAVSAGLVDDLEKSGFAVFGPTKLAGQIEWDKAFSREFMKEFKIPAPKFKICKSEKEGTEFLKNQKNQQWFIKASGLASGKGALYANGNKEAIEKIKEIKDFGKAAETYLIEECIVGEEFSSFAIVDAANFILAGHAQDHKRIFDGDLGPNTGGMGCSSPPLAVTPKVEKQIKVIFQKTARGLIKIKRPYRGVLYLGGMIDKAGKVFVIEFNARWGDPEAQVIIPSIKNDFYQLAKSVIDGNLATIKIQKDNLYRVAVTVASRGYPNDYKNVIGRRIFGLKSLLDNPDVKIYGAGVKKQNNKYLARGGRLFYVVAKSKNVAKARQIAYNALSLAYIEGNNLHYRTDIGFRDLERFYGKNQSRRSYHY